MQQKWAWHSTIDIESEKWHFLTMYEVKFVTSHEVINNNAFEPFAATVFENDMLYCDIETRNAGSFIKDILSSSVTIAKGIAKKRMEDVIDSDSLEKAIDISTNN